MCESIRERDLQRQVAATLAPASNSFKTGDVPVTIVIAEWEADR